MVMFVLSVDFYHTEFVRFHLEGWRSVILVVVALESGLKDLYSPCYDFEIIIHL